MDTSVISPQELQRRLEAGEHVTVIDVRDDEEYEKGHIPGALHIAKDEIEARMDEVPTDGLVVTY